MKRTISILLTSLLLFNSLGYVVFYQQVRFRIKTEMRKEVKRGMLSDRLEKIVVYNSDIAENRVNFKLVEANEFRLNGKMYDIVKAVKEPGRIIYYCIHDTKESALDELFSCLVESGSATNKSQPAQIVLKLLIKDGEAPSHLLLPVVCSSEEYNHFFSLNLLRGTEPRLFHPPEITLS